MADKFCAMAASSGGSFITAYPPPSTSLCNVLLNKATACCIFLQFVSFKVAIGLGNRPAPPSWRGGRQVLAGGVVSCLTSRPNLPGRAAARSAAGGGGRCGRGGAAETRRLAAAGRRG